MHNLEKKATAILRKQSKSLTEELGIFFTDLLTDLKRMNRYQIKKLSSSDTYIKEKLIANTLNNVSKFVSEFKTHMDYHSSVFADIIEKHRELKSIEEDNDFQLAIISFKKELDLHIGDLAQKATGLSNNLEFIEEKYEVSLSQQSKIDELKEELDKISAITYDALLDHLMSPKKHS